MSVQKSAVCSLCSLVLATRGLLLEHLALVHLDDIRRLASTHTAPHAPYITNRSTARVNPSQIQSSNSDMKFLTTHSSNQQRRMKNKNMDNNFVISEALTNSSNINDTFAAEVRSQEGNNPEKVTVRYCVTPSAASINAAPPCASACTITYAPHLRGRQAVRGLDQLMSTTDAQLLNSDSAKLTEGNTGSQQSFPSLSPPLSSPGTPCSSYTLNKSSCGSSYSACVTPSTSGYSTAPSVGPPTPSTSNDTPDPPTPETPCLVDQETRHGGASDVDDVKASQEDDTRPCSQSCVSGRTSYMKPSSTSGIRCCAFGDFSCQ